MSIIKNYVVEKEEGLAILRKVDMAYFATIDGDSPRVRMMSIIHHKNMTWAATIKGREKIDQIEANNKFEFSSFIPIAENVNRQIRVRGKAEIISNMESKKELSKAISFFEAYWSSPDDPRFILLRLNVDCIIIQEPTEIPGYPIFHKFDF